MTTLPISLNNGRTKALASCTALLLIPLIPVFILFEMLLSCGQKSRKSVQRKRLLKRQNFVDFETFPTHNLQFTICQHVIYEEHRSSAEGTPRHDGGGLPCAGAFAGADGGGVLPGAGQCGDARAGAV